jgi:centrosomal protein CEP41
MDIGDKFGKKGFMNKKVKMTGKYEHVQSKLKSHTGRTVKDVEVISDHLVAKRKFENFKRIKGSTLERLLGEQVAMTAESIYNLAGDYDEEEAKNLPDAESVYSLATNASQTSAVTYTTEQLGITSDTKFILLDLRDEEMHEKYHIKESINFPEPNISRDKVIPELYRYRNKEDKLIIVYMNDERSGSTAAKKFYEKGYDNIYLLSGGIEEFILTFPDQIVGKQLPDIEKLREEKELKDKKKKRKKI